MDRVRVGALLAIGGVALAAMPPLHAQGPGGEQALIDRLRQIQDQLTPSAAQSTREGSTAPEPSEASTQEGSVLGEDEVRSLVAEGLGVEILNIEAVQSEGRPAYAVTAMSPPGNENGAFAIETILVDGATGGLLERVPQTPRVAGSTESTGSSDPDRSGLEIRRRTYR